MLPLRVVLLTPATRQVFLAGALLPPTSNVQVMECNSFVCHRSEKPNRKSNHCHTSKNQHPQVLCLPHLRLPPPVLDFSGEFGNASSIHTFGQKARAAVETAREQVAALIGARPQEIFFTSGGTESDNHAIFGIVGSSANGPKSRPHVITSFVEHEAVLNACQALEKQGVDVTYLHVDQDGLIDLEDLRGAIRQETVLITIMHANNE